MLYILMFVSDVWCHAAKYFFVQLKTKDPKPSQLDTLITEIDCYCPNQNGLYQAKHFVQIQWDYFLIEPLRFSLEIYVTLICHIEKTVVNWA